jgi:hypothetical protein
MTNIIVGIYKIPPLWDRIEETNFPSIDNIDFITDNNLTQFNEHNKRITNIQNNVYFELFEKISEKLHVQEKHYIFIDENLTKNQKCVVNKTNIWVLKSHNDLCFFRNADVYFFRGNYLNYYNNFINNKKSNTIYFYPATSFVYKYYKNNELIPPNTSFLLNKSIKKEIQNKLDHPFYKKIDVVFIHENDIYLNIFSKSKKKILFNKPPCTKYYFLNLKREYDFIFIGDATQHTKNHHLMFHFINYCETNSISIKVIYISDKELLKNKVQNFIDEKNLKYVNLTYDNYLTPTDLNIYMNKSKINLIFSGRDAFPRTITETLCAGCYNIALDTLSDGKNVIVNPFGKIIGNEKYIIEILKSSSISYINNNKLWEEILDINKNVFDHSKISSEALKEFSFEKILASIIF